MRRHCERVGRRAVPRSAGLEGNMSLLKLSFLLLLLLVLICCLGHSVNYQPCPYKVEPETREVRVFTCDTRKGWREFLALRVWNVTGLALRDEGLQMINVCSGKNWGQYGFLTKPLTYLEHLKQLPKKSQSGGDMYAVLMDSDTFWSATSIKKLWNKFDCGRGNKEVLLSTEMACWVGRFCTAEDIARWYSNIASTPSYSPFANSGVIMGKVPNLIKMLEHVVVNNQSYYITYMKNKFDDQYAIADYAIKVAPDEVELDYHQQFSAGFTLHAEGDEKDDGWPFRCKTRNHNISMSCPDWTKLLTKLGHYIVDPKTCLAQRKFWDAMPMKEEVDSLAQDPIIWHGNGAGKRVAMDISHHSFICYLKSLYNISSVEEYSEIWGYGR